jgi:hypothetical protein
MMRRTSFDLGENHETGKIKHTKVHVEEVASIRTAAKKSIDSTARN